MLSLRRSVEPWYFAFLLANLVMGTSSVLIPLKLHRVLELGTRELGLLATCSSTAAVLGSLLWGRLSDAVHRRKAFVVVSYAMAGLAHVGLAFSGSFAALVLHNTLLSFFWVANASVAVLLVIEWTEEETWESHISILNLSGGIGWLVGLVAGGVGVSTALHSFSQQVGMEAVLLALAAVALAAAALALWLIPPTRARFSERTFRGLAIAFGNLMVEVWRFNPLHLYHRFSPKRLLNLRRETRLFLVASALAFTGIGFFAVPLALVLSQRLGYSPSFVYYGYVMLHFGVVLAYPFAVRRIKQRGNRRVQMAALGLRIVLFALGGAVLWTIPIVPWIAAAPYLFLIGVSWSFFQLSGVALTSRLAKPENRGLALGTYNAVAGGCTALAGASSGYLAEQAGYHATYVAAAVLLLAAVAVLSRLPDPAVTPLAGADGEVHRPAADVLESSPRR